MNPIDDELDRQLNDADEAINETIQAAQARAENREGGSSNRADLEKAALEASLEDSIIKYTQLSNQYGQLEHELKDAQLIFQHAMMEKDMKLIEAETDLTTLKLDQAKLLQSAQEADALRESVKTLTEWHADLTTKLAICEEKLHMDTVLSSQVMESKAQMQAKLDDMKLLCELLENSNTLSNELIELFTAVEAKLKDENKYLKQETQSLKGALQEGLAAMAYEKEQMSRQLVTLAASKEALEKRLKQIEPQLIPTWEKLAEENKETGKVSQGAHALALSILDLQDDIAKCAMQHLQRAVSVITKDSRLAVAISPAMNKFIISINQLRSFLSQVCLLCQHLVECHFPSWLDLMKMSLANMKKDKALIRWVQQTLKDLTDVVFWIIEMCQYNMKSGIPGDQLFELSVDGQSFYTHLEAAHKTLDIIMSGFINEKMSTALSTQSLAMFSRSMATFLVSHGYSEDVLQDQAAVPVALQYLYAPRLMAGLLTCVVASDEVSPGIVDMLETALEEALKDFKNLEIDPFKVTVSDHEIVFTMNTKVPGKKEGQVNMLKDLLSICASLEYAAEVADTTETWSTIELSSVREMRILDTKMTETFIATFVSRYEAWMNAYKASPRTNPISLLTAELSRWVLKQMEATVLRSETLAQQASVKFGATESMSPETVKAIVEEDSEKQRLKEHVALLEVQVERLKKQERDFLESEEKQHKVLREMNELNRQRDLAERSARTMKAQVDELTERVRVQDETLKQFMLARREREMAPPSIASFELLKTKASLYKLQDVLNDMATFNAQRDWALSMRLLDLCDESLSKPCEISKNESYQRLLSVREKVIEAGSQNVGLDVLKTLLEGNKKVTAQELFIKHQNNRRKTINLKSALLELTAS